MWFFRIEEDSAVDNGQDTHGILLDFGLFLCFDRTAMEDHKNK